MISFISIAIFFLTTCFVAVSSKHVDTEQTATWGPCPPDQTENGSPYLRDCITLQFPLDRSDLSKGNVNAFMRRFYVNQPTNNSFWLIAGGPGFSTRGFNPEANYFVMMSPGLTAYTLDARGTGLSSLLTCNNSGVNPGFTFDPFNTTNVNQYRDCNAEIIANYGSVLQYYTSYTAAQDLLGAINFVNPATVAIYAQSYGTYFTNVYMQLPGARFDAILLDGPVPPNRWVLENSAPMNSLVSQNVINLCVQNSSVCAQFLGEMGDLPQLVMQSVIDRTLPCLKYLPWLNATDGHYWTAIFTNFMTATRTAQPLLGPFWYRLYRCSASDVTQLNKFYSVSASTSNDMDVLDFSYGLGMNIAISELYSFAGKEALTYDQQLLLTGRAFSSDGGLSNAYAIYVSNFPQYPHNPQTYLKFANTDKPILILVGTLDPNTEQGLGPWFQQGLGTNHTQLITVPYATHGTVAYDAPCVDSISAQFIGSLGKAKLNTTCLNSLVPPDFDGSNNDTQDLSMQYFGTRDLWNDGFQKDVNPEPNSCPVCAACSNDDDDDDDFAPMTVQAGYGAVIALVFGLIIAAVLLFMGGFWLGRQEGASNGKNGRNDIMMVKNPIAV
jgi:pimeloyl-ACP methyl ester carboxylesterase